MIIYFIFSDYFYGAFNLGLPMKGYSDLTEAAFSQHSANLIPILDILDLLESFKIFKIKYMEYLLFLCHTVLGGIFGQE